MGEFLDTFLEQAPEGTRVPRDLARLWDHLESQGLAAEDFLDLCEEEDVVNSFGFLAGESMDWLLLAGHELIDNPRLVPIANTDSTESVAAMYFTDGHDPEYLFFDSDGAKPYRLAENTLDFLRLISIGYEEITPSYLYGEEHDELVLLELLAPLRTWVAETFDVQVPTAWPKVAKRPL